MDRRKRGLSPDEPILGAEGLTVGDFWSWAYSDIVSNRNRAVFAEFLVGAALGVLDEYRVEWDAVDLRYRGKTVEVKSSAYLQSWPQGAPSKIIFDIAKKKSWDAETNTHEREATRTADCYVFCVYPETDANAANILDVPRWDFYVLATRQINQHFADQKTAGLKALRSLCDAVAYAQLRARIHSALNLSDP